MKKITVSINISTKELIKLQEQGYEVTFTQCDETNSCYCHDCVQFGFIKHPTE